MKKAEETRCERAIRTSPEHVFRYRGIGNPGIGAGRKNIARWLREIRGR